VVLAVVTKVQRREHEPERLDPADERRRRLARDGV